MSINKKTRSDVVAASIKQYLAARGFKQSSNKIRLLQTQVIEGSKPTELEMNNKNKENI